MTRRLLHDPRPRLLLALAVLCPDLPGVPQDGQDGAPVAVVTETHTHLGERPLAPVPVTLSRVGCPGDFTEGITPLVDGRALPAQVDVLARNADDSIRHALVSFVLPPAADARGDGSLELAYANAAPAEPPPFEWALPERDRELLLELTDEEGRVWTSRVPLDQGPPGAPIPGARTLIEGPVLREHEVHAIPTGPGGEPHPGLDVFWRLREFTGEASMRVAVIVETSRLGAGGPRARLGFEGLRLTCGGDELATRGPYEQLDRTRFRLLAWTDGALERIHRRPNLDYLVRGRFFPPYEAGGQGFDAAAAEARYAGSQQRFGHLMPGVIHPHMPGTGDRPDIGPYPGWLLAYLHTGSPRLYLAQLHADGNGGGAFPIHLRRAPEVPGVDHRADRKRVEARLKLRLPHRRETAAGTEPDRAHAPSLGYLAYILTGDRYYAEELSFWASYQLAQWPWVGIDPDAPERTQAWGLRHVVDAAFLLPDEHPLKEYFAGEVDAYAARLDAIAAEREGLHWLRDRFKVSGRAHWVNCKRTSPWQYAWIVWSLGNAVDKGFESARGPRDWAAEYIIGLYTTEDEFEAPDGVTYRFDPRDAMQSNLATARYEYEVHQRNGQRYTTLGRKLEDFDNYAQAWYWTKVNSDNAYSDARGLRRSPDEDGVWPLDDPGWGHGRASSERWAYNWNRYGAWVALVAAVNANLPGADEAWLVMTELAGPGSQHGFNMRPRAPDRRD